MWELSERDRAFVDRAMVVVLVLAVGASAFLAVDSPPRHGLAGASVLFLLQLGVSLLLPRRHRAPVLVAVAAAGTAALSEIATATGLLNSPDIWEPLILGAVAENLAASTKDRRHAPFGWLLIALVAVLSVRPWDWAPGELLHTLVPALAGLYLGAHRRLIEALADRVRRAEREQELLAEQARAQERSRLAAEMHDIVSHRVTLMVLQAGALRVTATDEATRGAAEELRATGCEALGELRDLVRVLHMPPEGAEVRPDLGALVAESESVGTPVDFVQSGEPAGLSPVVARTVHRLVQEALTNVRKHAPGAPVTVQVRYDAHRVRLTIANARRPSTVDVDLAASGSGAGLDGLRRRVELVGGTLRAGPRADGGFELAATLPTHVVDEPALTA